MKNHTHHANVHPEDSIVAARNDIITKISLKKTSSDFVTPPCYKDVHRPELNMTYLLDETLFYIFHNCVREQIQLEAFRELIARNYYYHSRVEFFVMLTNPAIVDNRQHCVCFFNSFRWKWENVILYFDEEFVDSLCRKV